MMSSVMMMCMVYRDEIWHEGLEHACNIILTDCGRFCGIPHKSTGLKHNMLIIADDLLQKYGYLIRTDIS